MIYLKNVKKINNYIIADYFPEDSKLFSRISLNVNSLQNFKGKLVGHDIETKNHMRHAKFALVEMAEGKREIKDYQIMWY